MRGGPRYLACLRKAAEALRLGKAPLADVLAQAAYKEHRRALGEADPSTLAACANLALLRKAQGRAGEAEELLRRVLEGRGAVLGADHPDVAAAADQLAWVLQDQGKLQEAAGYYSQVGRGGACQGALLNGGGERRGWGAGVRVCVGQRWGGLASQHPRNGEWWWSGPHQRPHWLVACQGHGRFASHVLPLADVV